MFTLVFSHHMLQLQMLEKMAPSSLCLEGLRTGGGPSAFGKIWVPNKLLLMAETLHLLIGSLSHYLQGFVHPRWCRISSINSINKKSLGFNAIVRTFKYYIFTG